MKRLFLLFAAGLMPAANLVAQGGKPEAFRIGGYEVYVLAENSSPGNAGILIDAPQAVLDECAPGGTFPSAVNAVLIKGDGKVWLVDTGLGQNIFARMAELGVGPADVDYVYLTHMHGDHTGGMLRDGEKVFPNAEVIVSRREHDHWASRKEMEKQPPRARGNFEAAQKIFSAYADKLTLADPKNINDEMDNGLTTVAAYGHTPGHMMLMIRHRWKRLLIWADLTHAMAVQMPHPEISVRYDTDPAMARESRLEVLRDITTDSDWSTYVIGMHVPAAYPGMVHKGERAVSYVFDAGEI